MDPHFLPSLYPGIFVGIILGIASGGWATAIVGGIGGLVGAALALEIEKWVGLGESFLSLVLLIACSAAGAKVLIVVFQYFKKIAGR